MSEAKATRPYPLRIPENLMQLAEAKGRRDRTDRATALRQFLYAGAEDYALALLAEGRMSAGRAAEILDTSVHRVHELAAARGVEIGGALEDHRRARETARELFG